MPTHAYLSARVSIRFEGKQALWLQVKAHTFEPNRFLGDRIIKNYDGTQGESPFPTRGGTLCSVNLHQIVKARASLRELACNLAEDVPEEAFTLFGTIASGLAYVHGEGYPTWIGDHYIKPLEGKGRGKDRVNVYLITEAPDLDCGYWEEDSGPLWWVL